jgi:hypothetical protein
MGFVADKIQELTSIGTLLCIAAEKNIHFE